MRRNIIIILISIFLFSGIVYGIEVVRVASMTYSVKSSNTSVGGTRTALPATSLAGREAIAIYNNSASTITVYVGGSDVTTSNGFPLTSSCPAITLDLDDSAIIYGITSGSTADTRILEAK